MDISVMSSLEICRSQVRIRSRRARNPISVRASKFHVSAVGAWAFTMIANYDDHGDRTTNTECLSGGI
jgi:hypothetical protein